MAVTRRPEWNRLNLSGGTSGRQDMIRSMRRVNKIATGSRWHSGCPLTAHAPSGRAARMQPMYLVEFRGAVPVPAGRAASEASCGRHPTQLVTVFPEDVRRSQLILF